MQRKVISVHDRCFLSDHDAACSFFGLFIILNLSRLWNRGFHCLEYPVNSKGF